MSAVCRWPRGCSRGVKQKKSFLTQGLDEGYLSLQYPFFIKGLASFNYLANSRCTIKEDILKQYEDLHTAANAPPSEALITVKLPQGVRVYGSLDDQTFVERNSLKFKGVRPGQTRILFLDYHQVLDRAAHST